MAEEKELIVSVSGIRGIVGESLTPEAATAFAAALGTWAAGMYVFLELAPALGILPVMWWLHRPPLRLRALAVGAGVTLVIWYPYLAFEAERGFVDLRSQVL